jgi:hypothetical protein
MKIVAGALRIVRGRRALRIRSKGNHTVKDTVKNIDLDGDYGRYIERRVSSN